MKTSILHSNPAHPAQRAMMASAALIAALTFSTFTQAADATPPDGQKHDQRHGQFEHGKGRGQHGPMTPEQADKRLERRIDRMLGDASPEQKTKVIAIAKAAAQELRPLREQRRAARQESRKLLLQPNIDRAALERVRAREQQLAEQISKRMLQARADSATVLTLEQRIRLDERMHARMRGHKGGHRG